MEVCCVRKWVEKSIKKSKLHVQSINSKVSTSQVNQNKKNLERIVTSKRKDEDDEEEDDHHSDLVLVIMIQIIINIILKCDYHEKERRFQTM